MVLPWHILDLSMCHSEHISESVTRSPDHSDVSDLTFLRRLQKGLCGVAVYDGDIVVPVDRIVSWRWQCLKEQVRGIRHRPRAFHNRDLRPSSHPRKVKTLVKKTHTNNYWCLM